MSTERQLIEVSDEELTEIANQPPRKKPKTSQRRKSESTLASVIELILQSFWLSNLTKEAYEETLLEGIKICEQHRKLNIKKLFVALNKLANIWEINIPSEVKNIELLEKLIKLSQEDEDFQKTYPISDLEELVTIFISAVPNNVEVVANKTVEAGNQAVAEKLSVQSDILGIDRFFIPTPSTSSTIFKEELVRRLDYGKLQSIVLENGNPDEYYCTLQLYKTEVLKGVQPRDYWKVASVRCKFTCKENDAEFRLFLQLISQAGAKIRANPLTKTTQS